MSLNREQKSLRLFSAISLLPSWVSVLRETQRQLAARMPHGVRWTPPGSFHATVRFIGNLPTAQAEELVQAWRTFELPEKLPVLSLTTCGCFPPTGPERILWAGAEAISGSWLGLVGCIDVALSNFGLALPLEEPVIHITIGRVSQPGAVRGARDLLSSVVLRAEPLPVESVGLFISAPTPTGSRYVQVASTGRPHQKV